MTVDKQPITFFLSNLRGGGIQKVTLQLIEELIRRGIAPVLVVVDASGPNREHVPQGCRLVDLGRARVRQAILALFIYLRKDRTGLAISSQTHLNAALIFIRAITGYPKKVIVCEHITFNDEIVKTGRYMERMRVRLIRFLYPWASAFVAVSRGSAASIQHYAKYQGPVRVIRNGIDLEKIQRLKGMEPDLPDLVLSGTQKLIVGLGRLSYQKNFTELLNAFSLLEDRSENHLVVMGEGEQKEQLIVLARNLGIGNQVHFPGYLENPYPVLAAADVFVLPSRWEGFATAVLEALACGLPIVATDCPGGPAEILEGEGFARIVPQNQPAAMAKAISDLLETQVDCSEIVRFASNFSIERMADQYLELFAELRQGS